MSNFFLKSRLVSTTLQVVGLLAITIACRYAYVVAGGAVDLRGLRYMPLWFVFANISVLPGVTGTTISWNRRKHYWIWWTLTMFAEAAALGLWLLPCYDPSIMHASRGPMSMPSLFPALQGALVIGCWLMFFAVAFCALHGDLRSNHRPRS